MKIDKKKFQSLITQATPELLETLDEKVAELRQTLEGGEAEKSETEKFFEDELINAGIMMENAVKAGNKVGEEDMVIVDGKKYFSPESIKNYWEYLKVSAKLAGLPETTIESMGSSKKFRIKKHK